MIPIPNALPNPDWTRLRARLEAAGHNVPQLLQQPIIVIALRGLFSNSIGAPGNDINAYDDAVYVIKPQRNATPIIHTFNANTDPTRYGWNPNADKYMARLKPGAYQMCHRLHRGKYWAFGQASTNVTVERIDADGKVRQTETGQFGIDLHPGGNNGTSSEGCQTIPPDQWSRLYNLLHTTAGSDYFPYILLDA